MFLEFAVVGIVLRDHDRGLQCAEKDWSNRIIWGMLIIGIISTIPKFIVKTLDSYTIIDFGLMMLILLECSIRLMYIKAAYLPRM
jgi:hypothetical protein